MSNNICKVLGCNIPIFAKKICRKHYYRYRNHQSFDKLGPKGERNCNWRGGVSEYTNHYLMKKNRLIILLNNPICEICKKEQAQQVHHKDNSKDNHGLNNLMAICTKCHANIHHTGNNYAKKTKEEI